LLLLLAMPPDTAALVLPKRFIENPGKAEPLRLIQRNIVMICKSCNNFIIIK
jgi:hypothetical protein